MGTVLGERADTAAEDRGPTVHGDAQPTTRGRSVRPGRERWWAAVPVLAPILAMAEGLLGRRLLAPDDGIAYFLPMHVLVARSWAAGRLPSWDPWSFGGSPLLGWLQAGAFYPPVLLHVVLPPVLAHNAGIILSFAIAGAGTYLLALRLCGDRVGAAVAGVAFGLSSYLFGHMAHVSLLASLVWLPWALWALDRLRASQGGGGLRPGRLAAAAVPITLSALGGHAQLFAVTAGVVLGYGALVAVLEGRAGQGRALALAVLAVGAGVALAAIQLLPTLAAVGESTRAEFDLAEATRRSFSPGSSLLLLFPWLYGGAAEGPLDGRFQGMGYTREFAGYVGAAALALAAAGLAAVRRDKRLIALSVLAVVGLLVAQGASSPLRHVVHALPIFGQFRGWGRYVVVLDLLVALLAAFGVAALRHAPVRQRRSAATRAAVAVAVLAAAGLATPFLPGVSDRVVAGTDAWLAIGGPVLAAGLAAGIAWLTVRRWPGLVVALVPLVFLDAVVVYASGAEWRKDLVPPERVADYVADDPTQVVAGWEPLLAPDDGGLGRFLYVGERRGRRNVPRVTDARRLPAVNGYDPLLDEEYRVVTSLTSRGSLRKPNRVLDRDSHVADLLRVSLVLSGTPGRVDPERYGLRAPQSVSGGAVDAYRRTPRLPEAFVVGAAEVVDHDDAVEAVIGNRPLDPAALALVEERCDGCPVEGDPGPAGSVTATSWGDSSVSLDVEADRPGLAVVSQAWSSGWEATVDGEPAPVVRVDGLVQGVPVSAGRSEVELRYRPPGFAAGVAVSGATALLVLGWGALRQFRGRRPRPATP